jgi:hypothetical protein
MQWNLLLQWATSNYRKRKNIHHIIARLSMFTIVYYIWFERNNRIFTASSTLLSILVQRLFSLLGLTWKTSAEKTLSQMLYMWNMEHAPLMVWLESLGSVSKGLLFLYEAVLSMIKVCSPIKSASHLFFIFPGLF